MNFRLEDYEPVEARLARFWADYPNGRIATQLERCADGEVLFSAAVYRDAADTVPAATGYAHEVVTQRGVNATSAVENCETSAIGRALANAGYATKGKRPSREEMTKAQRQQTQPDRPNATPEDLATLADSISNAADLSALTAAGQNAATYAMTDDDRATLRATYIARKNQLEGQPA